MAYTTINKPSDYFNTKLYTGNDTGQSITMDFAPDWVWIKSRTNPDVHGLYDSIRGALQQLRLPLTNAERTHAGSLTSFDSDGFTVGNDDGTNDIGQNFVSWNWLANGAGSANTDGSISSTVSANTTSGFSIVKWTGNGTAGATVGHGLGSEMKFMILKDYSLARTWIAYHHSLGGGSGINFNETGAANTSSSYWNNTDATSSVFSTGVYSNENNSNYICYCFAEKQGFSKFGSYTGNGNADGTFVYTGFKPAFILYKNVEPVSENWEIHDTKRSESNISNKIFYANQSTAEVTTDRIDILSNGFKSRTANSACNSNGNTYIYMAFAEAPLVGSNNVPTTAR